ncbi:MAG: PilZ domain-containing protein [Pyrinomonadaceae bacterium]
MSKQVVAARREHEVPIKITFEPDRNTGRLRMPAEELFITGETKDLSTSGIAFTVSAIRINEYYLVGEDRILNAELDLPNEKVKMQIIGKRYEQVGEHISVSRYLIGAKIVHMSEENREAYEHFLRYGKKLGKNRNAGSLQLGIDES